jgi:hypothetical protein
MKDQAVLLPVHEALLRSSILASMFPQPFHHIGTVPSNHNHEWMGPKVSDHPCSLPNAESPMPRQSLSKRSCLICMCLSPAPFALVPIVLPAQHKSCLTSNHLLCSSLASIHIHALPQREHGISPRRNNRAQQAPEGT